MVLNMMIVLFFFATSSGNLDSLQWLVKNNLKYDLFYFEKCGVMKYVEKNEII